MGHVARYTFWGSAEADLTVYYTYCSKTEHYSTIIISVAAAPTTWNTHYLPLHIRSSSSIFGFRRQLKTFLYKLAFEPF